MHSLFKLIVGGFLLSAGLGLASASTPIFLNEIHYDNVGADTREAFEVAGPAGTDLSGWSVVLYNGGNGTSYATYSLTGVIADSGNGFGFVAVNAPGLQNGAPDGLALVNSTGAIVQFLSYEGAFAATNGPAAGHTSTDIGVVEDGSDPVGYSLQLSGSGIAYEDFTWAADAPGTFGLINTAQSFSSGGTGGGAPPPTVSSCGQPAITLSAVQGSTDASPLNGQTVTVEAIVTAAYQGSDQLKGFFLQEEDADSDGNPATSEGIFVYDPGDAAHVGDQVRLTARVSEYNTLTELTSVTGFERCAVNQPLPTPGSLQLPVASLAVLEAVEGMRVAFSAPVYVAENYNLARYGQFYVSGSPRLSIPTNVVAPGAAANALAAQNALNRILVDDFSNVQNPAYIRYPAPGLTADNTLRTGTGIAQLIGVVDFAYGEYRVQPTVLPLTYVASNPRRDQPAPMPGARLLVGSFNVLNYFNGDGNGGGFPTSRGANTLEEFQRQSDKIANAISTMKADVLGLMELENDGFGSTSAIATLVGQVNLRDANNHYAYVNPGVAKIGTDEIAVGLIYRSDTVEPVGSPAILDSSNSPLGADGAPLFNDQKNRPMLTQTFRERATGAVFTVAVNHLKSKGSDCLDVNDPDIGDGQGNCNLTRTKAAEAIALWLKGHPTGQKTKNVLIIGDLNAYAKEDPITALKHAGYVDEVSRFGTPKERYSYVYKAESGYIDHALASVALSRQIVGTSYWHINADEPRALDYNEAFKTALQIQSLYSAQPYRSSDHDPVLVGLALAAPKAHRHRVSHHEHNGHFVMRHRNDRDHTDDDFDQPRAQRGPWLDDSLARGGDRSQ